MARYVWNDRLKQSIRFSYWNGLCVIDDNGALVAPVLKLMDLFFRRLIAQVTDLRLQLGPRRFPRIVLPQIVKQFGDLSVVQVMAKCRHIAQVAIGRALNAVQHHPNGIVRLIGIQVGVQRQ